MPRVTLRRATLRDLDVLVAQRRAMFEAMGEADPAQLAEADGAYRRWVRARLRSGRLAAFLGVLPSGEAVAGGCVWLREVQPKPGAVRPLEPYILSVYTEPRHRGRGLATRITRACLAWAREQGYPRVRLHASKHGRPVYRRLGFERSWEMRLDLAPSRARRPRRRQP